MTAQLQIGDTVPLTLKEMAARAAAAQVPKPSWRPRHWKVLVVFGGFELQVAAALVEMGIKAYLPIMLKRHLTGRKVIELGCGSRVVGARGNCVIEPRMVPMFPGYVFAYLPIDGKRDRHAREVRGVFDFLRFDVDAAVMPEAVIWAVHGIEWVNLQEHEGEFDLTRGRNGDLAPPSKRHRAPSRFAVGDTVKFASDSVHSAFAAHLAKIDRLDVDGRIGVLMSLFGRPTSIVCDESELEVISG